MRYGRVCLCLGLTAIVMGCGTSTELPAPETAAEVPSPSLKPALSGTRVVTAAPDLQPVPDAEGQPVEAGMSAEAQRADQAFRRLLAAAQGDRPDDWTAAEAELKELGSEIVPALIPFLADDQPLARELAVMFLAQVGPDAAPARDSLIPLLTDPSPFIRVNAASLLTTFEDPPAVAITALSDLLSHEDPNLRVNVLFALGNVPESAADLVPAIAASLDDENPQIRQAAANTLSRLGEPARSSLPRLRNLLEDSDPAVKEAALFAVRVLDPAVTPASGTSLPASAESTAE